MHASLVRFVTDLNTGLITHDGCPITATHIANARRAPKPGQKYLLAKPHGAYHQKIDAAMASVLAHEAAADCRAEGLDQPVNRRVRVFR
jgi:phage terminase large subunit-like protein